MAPNEFQGSVIGGINKRSGIIQNTDMSDDGSGCVVQADVPLAQVSLANLRHFGLSGACVEYVPSAWSSCDRLGLAFCVLCVAFPR